MPTIAAIKLCECGCGGETRLVQTSSLVRGDIKGERHRFINGHNRRKANPYREEDRGYDTPCWIWNGHITKTTGYGSATLDSKTILAHRFMFIKLRGPVPEGLNLDHLCRVRECVNPEHLEPVTHDENCWRGHGTKLTPQQVREVRLSEDKGCVLAARHGVSEGLISDIRNGGCWKGLA
jgi:hypothetical protein